MDNSKSKQQLENKKSAYQRLIDRWTKHLKSGKYDKNPHRKSLTETSLANITKKLKEAK